MVKGSEGARVLRSGRRLWLDSDACRLQKSSAASLVGGSGDGEGVSTSGRKPAPKQDCSAPMIIEGKVGAPVAPVEATQSNEPKLLALDDEPSASKSWGVVYLRKRKRLLNHQNDSNVILTDVDGSWRRSPQVQDMMYGKCFAPRQRRKKRMSGHVGQPRLAFAATFDSTVGDPSHFGRFLSSILGYMTRVRVSSRKLTALLTSGAIHEVFSSHGTYFSRDLPCSGFGIFKFFGTNRSVPVFSLEFRAIPPYLLYMQINMLLLSRVLLPASGICSIELDSSEEEEDPPCISSHIVIPGIGREMEATISASSQLKKRRISRHVGLPLRSSARNAQRRNGYSPVFQTKRRSRRPTRVRSSSSAAMHKSNGHVFSSFFNSKGIHNRISSVLSDRQVERSTKRSSFPDINELKSSLAGVREDTNSTCCSANILICEADKCYREEGAKVMLESNNSKEWSLAVKRDGRVRYSHVAQKVLRPSYTNRYTLAMIWKGEDGWKLEFPDRRDWMIFKKLHRECCDRNKQTSEVQIIPVPGVWEVLGYEDSNVASFLQPDSYIVSRDDEVSRAMAKRTANYDLDSEDEEWLHKFNSEMYPENELAEDTFELMVDAFEKAQFCSPEYYSDEKEAINLCLDLGKREVIEAVHRYWVRRRKQKHSALIRIFQCHQPKRARLIPKSVLRKKRTFKQQSSLPGRGITAQQEALEEQNAMLRVEEAKVVADRSVELAGKKRKRAQTLMEKADLVIYRATLALRIAEAADNNDAAYACAAAYFDD